MILEFYNKDIKFSSKYILLKIYTLIKIYLLITKNVSIKNILNNGIV